MIIPEDGSLPQITRTGFTPFNNVMVVKLSKNLDEKEKTVYNLITLDSSKKGERWPAENCSTETTEIIKESSVPEVTENKVNSNNIKKSKANAINKQPTPSRKKYGVKKKQRMANKPKFVKKNVPVETKKYYDVQSSEIDPWLRRPALLPRDRPSIHSTYFKRCNGEGLLGSGPNDLVDNASIINTTLQNMLSRNIASTNLPISDCRGSREMPPVNGSFDNTYPTNFRNKLLPGDKYDRRFDKPYRDNSSELFPYNRNYNSAEREEFKNIFETRIGSSYDSNYMANPGDPAFRNGPYNFDATHITGHPENYAQSHRIDPLLPDPGPPDEMFMGTEREFSVDAVDGNFTNSYRNGHPQNKFARNGSSEAFKETSGGCYEDISYNTGYNEMPRNIFSEFQPFQNFRNNSGDKQRTNLNENNYMGTNRDYNRNHRGSNDSSPLNNSYENYNEMHRENPTDFYGQYENEIGWDNGLEPNPSFRDSYRRDGKQFHKRNKNGPWRKGSFRNARRNRSTRGRNNYRFDKKKS